MWEKIVKTLPILIATRICKYNMYMNMRNMTNIFDEK